jgi:hypothetical protein
LLIVDARGNAAERGRHTAKGPREYKCHLSSRDCNALLWLRAQSFRHANQLASHHLHRRLIVAFYLFHALVTCAEALVNSIVNAMPDVPGMRIVIIVKAFSCIPAFSVGITA